MRLLVVGASGFVGRHVLRAALAQGAQVVGTYRSASATIDGPDWRRLDITDAGQVSRLLGDVMPDAVVQTAAALAPSLGPIAPSVNWTTNALGAATVALACARAGVRLVHVSSDAVFSGRPEPLRESDTPAPVNPYGAAKAAAELAVAALHPTAAIVRVSLVCGEPGGEMARRERFMLDLAAGSAEGLLFTDDVRCPVAASDVASALVELSTTDFVGVLHIAGPDAVSFYELGVLVARRFGADPSRLPASTVAAASVSRPGNVVLDCSLAACLLRTRLRGVREVFAMPRRPSPP